MAGRQATGKPRYYRSPRLAGLPEVAHGFFTRQGGVSTGAYHSLNVSLARGDPTGGGENLGRMRQTLGLEHWRARRRSMAAGPRRTTSPDQARFGPPRGGHPSHQRPRPGPAHQAGGLPGGDVLCLVDRVVANVPCRLAGPVARYPGPNRAPAAISVGTWPADLYAAVGPAWARAAPSSRTSLGIFPGPVGHQVRPTTLTSGDLAWTS